MALPLQFLLVVVVVVLASSTCADDASPLRCQVCRRLVEDIRLVVGSVDPSRVVRPAAGFRLDGGGDPSSLVVPLARSHVYLAEVIDSACAKMDDYVRATYKRDGALTVMPLLVDGKMNPLMSEVDVVQDADLNKSLRYYCDDIVDDIEDDLIGMFKSGDGGRVVDAICTDVTKLCPSSGEETAARTEL